MGSIDGVFYFLHISSKLAGWHSVTAAESYQGHLAARCGEHLLLLPNSQPLPTLLQISKSLSREPSPSDLKASTGPWFIFHNHNIKSALRPNTWYLRNGRKTGRKSCWRCVHKGGMGAWDRACGKGEQQDWMQTFLLAACFTARPLFWEKFTADSWEEGSEFC